MHDATLAAFLDEVGEIVKEAGWLTNRALPYVRSSATQIGRNLAGTGKAFLHPVEGIKRGVKATAESMRGPGIGPKVNAALLAGGAVGSIGLVTSKEDPSGRGASQGARALQLAGQQVGALLGTPYGLTGGITGGVAGDYLGRQAGRVYDKIRGVKGKSPADLKEEPLVVRSTPKVGPVAYGVISRNAKGQVP